MSPTVGTMGDGNPCVEGCIDAFQQGMRDERARFKAAIQECNGDSACVAEQEQLHESIIGELQVDKGNCLDNCGHEQGGGLSGQ